MTRNYLTIVPLNNAGRNKFLDEMFDRHKSRYGAQKWDYLGADVCEVCLAACIGCNPKTVQRARLRKDKSSLVFRYSVMLRSISAAQTQSGVRCAYSWEEYVPQSRSLSNVGMRIIGRIQQMAEEEGNMMPNADKTKLPYPPKKERLEEFLCSLFSPRSMKKGTVERPPLEFSYSYGANTWRFYCKNIVCSRHSTFGS